MRRAASVTFRFLREEYLRGACLVKYVIAQCNYDLKEVLRKLRQLQASSGRKYVRYPARRTASADDLRASYGD